MKRRQFLNACAVAGLSATLGRQPAAASGPDGALNGLLIADPHAHPHQLHGTRSFDASTPTVEAMQRMGMALCAFAAFGDMTFMRGRFGSPLADTRNQLAGVRRMAENGQIRLVQKAADLQASGTLAGLMAI